VLSCDQFLAEFGDYLDNHVSSELRSQLEEHLRECKSCSIIVDTTCKTIRIVTDSESFALPEEAIEPIVEQVMSRIRGKSTS
jgi:hypothetical protein